jgi:hypothetical protein
MNFVKTVIIGMWVGVVSTAKLLLQLVLIALMTCIIIVITVGPLTLVVHYDNYAYLYMYVPHTLALFYVLGDS